MLVRGGGGIAIRSLAKPALALFALLALPLASAGTAEEPELSDAADDCQFPPANHYADVASAWVSDETETGFNVNLALSKWTLEPAAAFSGYTVQFEHQGVQFGIAAFFTGTEWEFSNAFIDVETGEMTGFAPAEGSFTPGTPAVISVVFDKGHFPHGDSADNKLVNFQAGTADFKPIVPWGVSPVPIPLPPPNGGYVICDLAMGDGAYTFQVGGHSTHDMGSGNATAPMGAAPAVNETARPIESDVVPAGGADAEATKESPGAGALGAILACVAAAVVARRRA